jgi:hypothetical protein
MTIVNGTSAAKAKPLATNAGLNACSTRMRFKAEC